MSAWCRLLFVLWFALGGTVFPAMAAEGVRAPIPSKRIFVLHSYSQEYAWTQGQHMGFVQAMNADSARYYDFRVEYLDTKRTGYGPAHVGNPPIFRGAQK